MAVPLVTAAVPATAVGRQIAGISEVYRWIREFQGSNAQSLSERAKAASVISRVYIDNTIADEEIMLPLLGAMNQLYIAYVITVLNLETYVNNAQTVRDLTKVVSTESLTDINGIINRNFCRLVKATESFGKSSLVNWDRVLDYTDTRRNELDSHVSAPRNDKFTSTQVVSLNDQEQHLVTGRLVEITVSNGIGGFVPINIFVQLIPNVVSPEVAGGFVGLNLPTTLSQRYQQARAGEIRFFRDFIFSLDRIKHYQKALKHDKGELARMLATQNNKLAKYWLNVSRIEKNHNSASSVLIMSKATFEKELAQVGTKFNSSVQDKFFRQSFMLFLAVVDTAYNTVDFYTHGISGHGSYSFQAIEKVGSSKKGGMDMKDVMTLLSRGNVPRF